MARQTIATTISLDGPFFTRDPAKTFRQNVRTFMAAVAGEAEDDARAKFQQGEGRRKPISAGVQPARVSGHVVGRTVSLAGKHWAVTAVVSVQNKGFSKKQGTALMAAAASIERREHPFRRMTARMRRAKAINQAELLKGIA